MNNFYFLKEMRFSIKVSYLLLYLLYDLKLCKFCINLCIVS